MKFDFKDAFVDQVLAVIQEAPVPFKVVNPMLQEFIRQVNDKLIQSLAYPVENSVSVPKALLGKAVECAYWHIGDTDECGVVARGVIEGLAAAHIEVEIEMAKAIAQASASAA